MPQHNYYIPSSSQGISVFTKLTAPSYSQDTHHAFLKGAKAREFARALGGDVSSALIGVLGLTGLYTGIYALAYSVYRQSIINKINEYSDDYPGVYIKVGKTQYGTLYAVEPWTDTVRATVEVSSSATVSESVVDVIWY